MGKRYRHIEPDELAKEMLAVPEKAWARFAEASYLAWSGVYPYEEIEKKLTEMGLNECR